ncbi:hypothetical protein [Inquilinus sp. Marseille-Q2685]|uniref:hypothetical protein n=1 Tax=Inquilinus sp. Marseille-Q2685 TaxID=2866581 RepID=UPI001CE48E47|nr:hypothetical protein [Inquilinus sp. Marseille-Q2685]
MVLIDNGDADHDFSINWWHWRAIVEAVRRTKVLPSGRVDGLHQACVGELDAAEACAVGHAIRTLLCPTLGEGERLLLDGAVSIVPPDGVFHREPGEMHKNYGTDRATLEAFAAFCERCAGFRVL